MSTFHVEVAIIANSHKILVGSLKGRWCWKSFSTGSVSYITCLSQRLQWSTRACTFGCRKQCAWHMPKFGVSVLAHQVTAFTAVTHQAGYCGASLLIVLSRCHTAKFYFFLWMNDWLMFSHFKYGAKLKWLQILYCRRSCI